MLIQEEARLKKQGIHLANPMGQKGAEKKPIKNNKKSKQGLSKLNQSFAQILKKEPSKDKCHLCKNLDTIKKIT